MIDLQYFASAINKSIGTNEFVVYLNTNRRPEESGKTVVSLSATRVPFGVKSSELDAESLAVTLTFDLSAKVIPRDKALLIIKTNLLGWQSFSIKQPDGEKYQAETFFEQQPPSNPYLDNGGITQQIVVSGNALIRNVTCGATVGNNIKVSIDGTELLKLTRAAALQSVSDNNIPLSEESTLPVNQVVSRVHTTQLTCIYTGKEIEKEFIKRAEGCTQDANKIYTYTVEYPDFATSVPVKIQSATVSESVGVFLQYTLSLQTVEEAEAT